MVFPKSNLATASQPWGRFVEKSITTLESLVATEKVNNAARDAQMALSIKRTDASLSEVAALGLLTAQNVADIQTITDSVFSLNTDVNSLESNVYVAGTTQINGYNIKAGTIQGSAILATDVIQLKDASNNYVKFGNQSFSGSATVPGIVGGTSSYPTYVIGPWVRSGSSMIGSTSYGVTVGWLGGNTVPKSSLELASDLYGGYINLSTYGGPGIYIDYTGVSITNMAKKQAWGSVSVPGGSGTTTSATVTFPSGRFDTTPMFVCTPDTSVPYTTVRMFGGSANSSTSATIYVNRTNATSTIFQWIALGTS